MAAADTSSRDSADFWGIVDMGSNGIRFTITDLGPPTTRRMPVLWSRRAGISLHDSLHSGTSNKTATDDNGDDDAGETADNTSVKDGILSQDTIDNVVREIKIFTQTCRGLGVPSSQMRVMATEATRSAKNRAAFISAIKQNCGIEVTLLPKEEEAYYGALGVRSSFDAVKGLMMDLGGGSMQLTYLDSALLGKEHKKPTGVSVPFGAAALNRGLSLARENGDAAVAEWESGIMSAVNQAFQGLVQDAPALNEALNHPNKLDLYLCGGGFRGWGNLLMHNRRNYPIPTIHAFKVKNAEFLDHTALNGLETGSDYKKVGKSGKDKPFRISERRKSQLPVVALLVRSVAAAIGQSNIGSVIFCQGVCPSYSLTSPSH
jgi:retrograde regulation protein 2